ncbi:MAG: hypothetical protein K1X66_08950 [Verrucomicrobiae bacterium]|nr:hypothetical protein [Verrucomicrobiae bacterium]
MKPFALFFLLLTSLTSFALEFKVDTSNELVLLDSNNSELQRFKPGVVDEAIDLDGQNFHLNYGEDINGLLMAVLSPTPDKPQSISVVANAITPAAVVAIEAGLLGKIEVNKKTVPGGMRWKPNSDSKPPYRIEAGKDSIVTIYWRTYNSPPSSVLEQPLSTNAPAPAQP